LNVRKLELTDIDACSRVLAALPEWFGIEESNRHYIESLDRLPGFVVEVAGTVTGFLALERTAPHAAEIAVMGVDPARHRLGSGRALVDAAERWCRDNGVHWLHVKTRAAATYDDYYERTRQFYVAVGFEPLYESSAEWGPGNVALVLIKPLR
jgi:GNAT superfamily N-acetyltransferase